MVTSLLIRPSPYKTRDRTLWWTEVWAALPIHYFIDYFFRKYFHQLMY